MTVRAPVLGLNRRNAHIARVNDRRPIWLAKDKLATKERLEGEGIPTAPTLAVLPNARAVRAFDWDTLPDQWVMKPARGSRGLGVWVVTGASGEGRHRRWHVGGRRLRRSQLRRAASSIVYGDASDTEDDVAMIEPLLRSPGALAEVADVGLPDIRIVCDGALPLLAMMRIPTHASGGRGNLHQGGVGAAVDMVSGRVTRTLLDGRAGAFHPDTGHPIVGLQIPNWSSIVSMSTRCAAATELGYVGVDVVVDERYGPLVLEVNSHPGLEIQNVAKRGLGLVS